MHCPPVGLIILWVVTGVKTTGVTSGTFKDCNTISVAAVQGLCGDAQTLVLFSLLTAGIREYPHIYLQYTAFSGVCDV